MNAIGLLISLFECEIMSSEPVRHNAFLVVPMGAQSWCFQSAWQVSLASAPRSLFAVWAPPYLRSLVHRSLALPAVSAFYRLIGLGLRLSQDFWGPQFKVIPSPRSDGGSNSAGRTVGGGGGSGAGGRSGSSSQQQERGSDEDIKAVAPLLRRYLQHVCVALERFRDELLCAALKMVCEVV